MKSGLEDRNNIGSDSLNHYRSISLNEVRPGRPEQCNVPWDSEYNNVVSQ